MTKRMLLALAFVPGLALAQAAPPPPPAPPAPDWTGKAELSFVSTSGNTDTNTLGLGAEVNWKTDPWSVGFKGAFIRAESDGDLKARTLDLALRGGYKLSKELEAYALCSYFENQFAGIDHRWHEEVGVAYTVFSEAPHKLKAEAGLGYTKEARVTGDDFSFATARAGLGYKWTITPTAEFTDDFGLLFDLKTSNDWRVQNVAALSANISTLLSMKLSWTLNFLNDPPPTFRKTDTITAAALVAKF